MKRKVEEINQEGKKKEETDQEGKKKEETDQEGKTNWGLINRKETSRGN